MFVSLWDGLQLYDALLPGDVDVSDILRRVAKQLFAADDPGSFSETDLQNRSD